MKRNARILYEQNLDDFGHLDDYQIMGLTIYAEARGEPRKGRIAVGTVILNRAEKRDWDGKTIMEVCLWPYQFSCYNLDDPNRPMLKRIAEDWDFHFAKSKPLQDCYTVARGLISGTISRDSDLAGCYQYLTPEAKESAKWWRGMIFVKTVGGHEFYRG